MPVRATESRSPPLDLSSITSNPARESGISSIFDALLRPPVVSKAPELSSPSQDASHPNDAQQTGSSADAKSAESRPAKDHPTGSRNADDGKVNSSQQAHDSEYDRADDDSLANDPAATEAAGAAAAATQQAAIQPKPTTDTKTTTAEQSAEELAIVAQDDASASRASIAATAAEELPTTEILGEDAPAEDELASDPTAEFVEATATVPTDGTVKTSDKHAANVQAKLAETPETQDGTTTTNPAAGDGERNTEAAAPMSDAIPKRTSKDAAKSSDHKQQDATDDSQTSLKTTDIRPDSTLAPDVAANQLDPPISSEGKDGGAKAPAENLVATTNGNPANVDPGARQAQPTRLPAQALAPPSAKSATPGTAEIDSAKFLHRVSRAFAAAQERGGEVRLRLSPPELGSLRLDVRVHEGVLVARLETETAAARTALIENLPALRDRLAEQGIRIERFDVDLAQQQSGGSPDQSFARPEYDDRTTLRTNRPLTAPIASESSTNIRTSLPDIAADRLNVIV